MLATTFNMQKSCVFNKIYPESFSHCLRQVDSSISYASLSALPPEMKYIQIVNYIMYFCWVNKTLELELEDNPLFVTIWKFENGAVDINDAVDTCILHNRPVAKSQNFRCKSCSSVSAIVCIKISHKCCWDPNDTLLHTSILITIIDIGHFIPLYWV